MGNIRVKYIVIGLIFSALLTFMGVACMQYYSTSDQTYIDMETLELVQTEGPKDGDTIAVINTSMGQIKAVLYPEYAPNAVANFIELAQSGYYDKTYVFQSEPGVYFGAGTPEKNGELAEGHDEKYETVVQELHQNLWPFKGALCSMTTGQDGGFLKQLMGKSNTLNGSRFAVLNTVEFTDEFKEELKNSVEGDTTVVDAFIERGGLPNLSQQITVFGQTYEGFEVIEAITSVEVNAEGDDEDDSKVPVEDIIIESIEIGTYEEQETHE